MKKIAIVSVLVAMLFACTGANKKSGEGPLADSTQAQLVNYKFKVDGVQNDAIADSIFRLHFKIEGIDKMIISEKDCTVVFTVDPELLNYEGLRKAVEGQGGVVIDK